MKTITLDYNGTRRKTINVKELPAEWQKWLEAWHTDDDDRTDAQWDEVEAHTFEEMLEEVFGEEVCPESVEVWDYQ